MDTNKDGSGDDEEVGYKKPPKKHRFKKGQSGNLKGRPKGTKNLRTVAQEVLNSPVRIKTASGTKTVTKQQGIFMRLCDEGLKGNVRAADRALAFAAQFNDEDPIGAIGDAFGPDAGKLLDDIITERAEQLMRRRAANQADQADIINDKEEDDDDDWLK